jgi:ubiquinone/menaquinone biosynthesis C-methylase UbiE
MLIINLGCGEDFGEDLIGVDIYDYGQPHVLDIEKNPLPFEDNAVDVIRADHLVEHLTEIQHVFNEAHRVLKKGGEFRVKVPNAMWQGAFMPPHKQHITLSWFDFFRKEKTRIYGYERWEIRVLEYSNNDTGIDKEITCVLTPIKL